MNRRFIGILAAVVTSFPTLVTASAHHVHFVPVPRPLLVGARAADVSFATMATETGSVKVTRLFYSGALPTTYSRQGIPTGVKLIISYKTPDTNVSAYVKSIPAGQDVEVCWHHEPEADFTTGALFTSVFDKQANLIHAANSKIPVAFIAGMYQYATAGHGYSGSFIPTKQDRNYADSYLPTARTIVPAATEPRLTRYRALLAAKGKAWDGFTEYGRGVIRKGAAFDPAVAAARAQTIKVDAAWLPTTTARVWAYWFSTDLASGDQWRFTDAGSMTAWRAAAMH